MAFRLIPRLEVKSGRVIKGIRMEGLRVVGDPIDLATAYCADGADEIFYEDIVASLYGRTIDSKLVQEISRNIMTPFAVAGGIRTEKEAMELIDCGADKVCLNTGALDDPNLIVSCVKRLGGQSVSVLLQAKKIYEDRWEVFTEAGRNRTRVLLDDWVKKVQDLGAGEVCLMPVDKDGTNSGPDLELLEKVKDLVRVPLLVGGGIRDERDIETLIKSGASGCLLAHVLHFQKAEISDLKNRLFQLGHEVRV